MKLWVEGEFPRSSFSTAIKCNFHHCGRVNILGTNSSGARGVLRPLTHLSRSLVAPAPLRVERGQFLHPAPVTLERVSPAEGSGWVSELLHMANNHTHCPCLALPGGGKNLRGEGHAWFRRDQPALASTGNSNGGRKSEEIVPGKK